METANLMNLAQSKEYEKILEVYQQHSIETIAEVADFLRETDVYNVAINLYQYLLNHKETADFHYGIGQCYGKTYHYQTSLYHLEKAFNLDNRTVGANYYAYILERNFLMDKADHWYCKALQNGYASDLWTLSHYAYFLEKNNKIEAAKQAYRDVLTKNPAYTWAVKRYAIFLLKQNEIAQSMQVMQDALAQYPNNPFVKLNYLEYLIIRDMGDEYEAYLQKIEYQELALPFQVLIDLFDYFWRYLLNDKSNTEKVRAYEEKVKQIKDTIHRDFDDFNEILIAKNKDTSQWKRLVEALSS